MQYIYIYRQLYSCLRCTPLWNFKSLNHLTPQLAGSLIIIITVRCLILCYCWRCCCNDWHIFHNIYYSFWTDKFIEYVYNSRKVITLQLGTIYMFYSDISFEIREMPPFMMQNIYLYIILSFLLIDIRVHCHTLYHDNFMWIQAQWDMTYDAIYRHNHKIWIITELWWSSFSNSVYYDYSSCCYYILYFDSYHIWNYLVICIHTHRK